MTAPVRLNGKNKVFEETFISPFEKDTKGDAIKVLDEIRKSHDEVHGWVEFDAYPIQKLNGKWVAMRHHAKYE